MCVSKNKLMRLCGGIDVFSAHFGYEIIDATLRRNQRNFGYDPVYSGAAGPGPGPGPGCRYK